MIGYDGCIKIQRYDTWFRLKIGILHLWSLQCGSHLLRVGTTGLGGSLIWGFPARKMGVPLYRWMVDFREHPNLKWMITRATPMTKRTPPAGF